MTTQRRAEILIHAPMAFVRSSLLAFLTTAVLSWSWQQNSATTAWFIPSSYWMSELGIEIPDHATGDDPTVVFHRKVKRRIVGEYLTEIRSYADEGIEVCTGTGTARYEPKSESEWIGPLSLYTGGCTIPPGCWLADTTIAFPAWGGAEKAVFVKSGPFAVRDGGAGPDPCAEFRSDAG